MFNKEGLEKTEERCWGRDLWHRRSRFLNDLCHMCTDTHHEREDNGAKGTYLNAETLWNTHTQRCTHSALHAGLQLCMDQVRSAWVKGRKQEVRLRMRAGIKIKESVAEWREGKAGGTDTMSQGKGSSGVGQNGLLDTVGRILNVCLNESRDAELLVSGWLIGDLFQWMQ